MTVVDILIAIFSALAGTVVSSVVSSLSFKETMKRSLKDLEAALIMCHEIREKLAGISVKIEAIEPIKDMLMEHEKKLYAMRSKSARSSRNNSNGGE